MKNPPTPKTPSETRSAKFVSSSRQYVHVNDLRSLLKLALGLHTVGDSSRRLTKAADGLARLANADAWVIKAFNASAAFDSARPRAQLTGGKDPNATGAAEKQVDSDPGRHEKLIRRLIAARHTPGRVLAAMDSGDAIIHSMLRAEASGRGQPEFTLVSLYRNATAPPFIERERRLVELFHSQSAWLILQMTNK